MEEGTKISIVSEENIYQKIYNIRGQKVMLDFELAEIYGYETKNFNRQVKTIQPNLKAMILCFNYQKMSGTT
jgi:hypothetical protein